MNLIQLLRFELLFAYRRRLEILRPLLFFIIVITLFPLAINPEKILLQTIAPGIIWINVLLSTLLFLDNLFYIDYREGTLDKLILSPQPLLLLVIIKIIAHWLSACFPLILITPLAALMFHLSGHVLLILFISLLLGTPVLSFIGAIGAALTLGLANGGLLLALLVLPLYIPVLIFGTGAVNQALLNMPAGAELMFLGVFLLLSVSLAPFAVASALKLAVNY